MSVINGTPLLAAAGGDYTISRSVRLRSSASAYFNRTLTTPTNANKWTWNGWVKLGALTGYQDLFFAGTSGSAYAGIWFNAGTLVVSSYNGTGYPFNVTSVPVYRDPSAWYMVTIVYDSTQATNTNRIQMWVNNQQITSFTSPIWPTQNTSYQFNTAVQHNIGNANVAGAGYFDGYLTEINFIDGQALTPTSFGQFNSVTGVWQPIKYTGTYGTNGFYLNFSDNSNNTATTIGKDYSGNGNNWTPNNISVTSGVTYDSMLDVPTLYADGGNGRGNYSVMNPLDYVSAAFSGTASDGNLTVSIPAPASSNGIASSIKVFSTAQTKFYIETTVTALTTFCSLGMISGTNANYRIRHTNDITINVNDVIMTAFDPATGNVWYGRNGTWLSSGNPSAGTNPWATMSAGEIVGSAFSVVATNGSTGTFTTKTTFGQQPFTYTPPSGYVALNTQNLPAPTISNGALYMAATTYTGTGSSLSVTNSGSMQPDLIWLKSRNSVENNFLFDSVRGSSPNYSRLSSNLTDAEATPGIAMLTAINSNGFTLGTNGGVNTNTNTYVGWQWKKGATPGFDIVTYTGTGANRTVAHSLGVAPSMIILKQRNAVDYWVAWHSALANTEYLLLNSTNAKSTAATYWNSTSPTSSVFSLGTDSRPNGSGTTYVAYLFAEVAGFSKFGSYTGNGSSTDGPFVWCGFRPRFILTKNITTGGYWWEMVDSTREPINPSDQTLYANVSDSEYTSSAYNKDLLSNGFKIRGNNGGHNASGDVYIFAAFAENPFKNSLAR